VRIIGAHLLPAPPARGDEGSTLVLLDPDGRISAVRHATTLAAVAGEISELAAGEPFLVGVDLPVVVPERSARTRPVESLVRRKLGYRLPPGGRAALTAGRGGVAGEALLAALSATGLPCLPYPDRDRRVSGVAEIAPGLALKVLLWEGSAAARAAAAGDPAERFRSYAAPDLRAGASRSKSSWTVRAAALDLITRVLDGAGGLDLRPVLEALGTVTDEAALERAVRLLDASVLASVARRYLEAPETCLFLGDREEGYTILPADRFVRQMAAGAAASTRARLFPRGTLRDQLGPFADLRAVDLLDLPGRPQRTEAVLRDPPVYEFDNLDEMLWWKHCRHVTGPVLPVEGLCELAVALGRESTDDGRGALRLVRSRHRTLSFRFDPPAVWRTRVPTRDGRTYPFRVLRALYETSPARD
jgi:predicted RNase H-like nuclease